jgi:hypothetical protein
MRSRAFAARPSNPSATPAGKNLLPPEAGPAGSGGVLRPHTLPAAHAIPRQDLIEHKNEIVRALREKERYSEQELQVLERAFDIMIRFRGEDKFPSGERIAAHLLRVAAALAERGSSPRLVSAGLLHMTTPEELESEGMHAEVIHLVRRKIALQSYLFIPCNKEMLTEREAEYLFRLCLMQEGDRDVWLLEAADEFITLATLSEEDKSAKPYASRAYHVTSPILSLSDLDYMAVELENIALLQMDRKEYERVEAIITDANTRDRLQALEELKSLTSLISEELNAVHVKHRVEIDVKSVSRTKKKLERGDELTDPSRFRFILDGSAEDCRRAMDIVKKAMEELGHIENPSERKNYIAGISLGEGREGNPKPNGYQSIHLLFRGEKFKPINVQIRTEEMHEVAELGSASHGRFLIGQNGMMRDAVVDGASAQRQRWLDQRRRYGRYKGNLYRLIPAKFGAKLHIIDLLFAISPDHGLRAPKTVEVERIDPQTGELSIEKHSIHDPLENGDRVLSFERMKNPSAVREKQLSTLPALIAHRLAREGKLNPSVMEERSSGATTNGKMALEIEISSWESELRSRLEDLLRREGEEPGALKLATLFSLERAARLPGLEDEAALHLFIGLARPQEKIMERIMDTIRSSSTASAYKISPEAPSHADLWLLVNDVPGVFGSVLNLFRDQKFGLVSLSSQSLHGQSALIKARVRVGKKHIKDDVLDFLTHAKDLYQSTRQPREGKTQRARIVLRLARLNVDLIGKIAGILSKRRLNIIKADFPAVLEKGSDRELWFEIPAGSFETFQRELMAELKRIGVKNPRITNG